MEIRSGGAGGPLLTVAHHDLDGQLVRLCDIRTGGTLSGSGASCTATGSGARQLELTWDASGRLSQAVVNGTTHGYTYDHADRRLSKTVAGTTTHYAYDGDDVYARFTAGWNAPTSVTVHGGGTDEPLWELTGATNGPTAAARYYHADGLGSVVALSDVGTGALTSERRYDAWGRVLPGAAGSTEYGFTGREPDETGLVYYRARYYEPTLGRFVSMDPAGMPDGVNRYAYVANGPLGRVDPSGMVARDPLQVQFATPQYHMADAGATTNVFRQTLTDMSTGFISMEPLPPDASAVARLSRGTRIAMDWGLIAFDVANSLVSPTPDVGIIGAAGIAGRAAAEGAAAARSYGALDDLSRAASVASGRNGLSVAGHALTKHATGQRASSSLFPPLAGNPAAINRQAQFIVDDILTSPGVTVIQGYRGRFGNTVEHIAPDGRGIVYGSDGKFLFFREGGL